MSLTMQDQVDTSASSFHRSSPVSTFEEPERQQNATAESVGVAHTANVPLSVTIAVHYPGDSGAAALALVREPARVTYSTASTQTETSMLDLFHSWSKRKWALSLAEQYMNIHQSFRDGDIILKSSDDVGFKFSLALLGVHSNFFKDLADLPRAEHTSNVIPLYNATASTIEVLLSAIDPRRSTVGVPHVHVLEELVNLVDAFDFEMSAVCAAVYDSGLNVGLKYAFAYGLKDPWMNNLALECVATGALCNCQAWIRCPEAQDKLRLLFDKWDRVHSSFKSKFVRTPVVVGDDFSRRCGKRRCPAFNQFRGNWANLKGAAANSAPGSFSPSPFTDKHAVAALFVSAVPCTTCAQRLSQHAARIWVALAYDYNWMR